MNRDEKTLRVLPGQGGVRDDSNHVFFPGTDLFSGGGGGIPEQGLRYHKRGLLNMVISGKSALAEYFRVSRTTVDSWIRRGCPYLTGGPGKPWTFETDDIEDWRADREAGGGPDMEAEKVLVRVFAGGIAFKVAVEMARKYKLKVSDKAVFSFIGGLLDTDRDLRDLMRVMYRNRSHVPRCRGQKYFVR